MTRWAWAVCVLVQVAGVGLWVGGVGRGAGGAQQAAPAQVTPQGARAAPPSPEEDPARAGEAQEPPPRAVAMGMVGAKLTLGEVERALGEVERALEQASDGAQGVEPARGEVEVALLGGRYVYDWDAVGAVVVSEGEEAAVRELVARGYVLRGGARSGAAGARALYGVDGAKARALFGGLAAAWEQAPIDARWDFARNQLIPHRVGVALDVEASVEALALALARGEPRVEAVARVVYPAARVDEGLLVGWSPTTLMGTLKTKYDAKKKDRSHNLALASSLLDGVILMPGQTVSYNEVVGERTLARGFREAPVIVHGEMLEGVGGGACQVSSTLYAVSLLTGLDIIERSSHSLPSPYIEKGLDAVVSWPHLDLKLKNSYPFPVAVKARLVENHVVVSLWGSEPPRKVVIRREVVEKLRFVERVEVTTELAPKQTKKVREGHFGYRISKGRITWEGETERFERMYEDVYLPRPRQVKIGPGTLYPDGGARAGASAGNDDALSVED